MSQFLFLIDRESAKTGKDFTRFDISDGTQSVDLVTGKLVRRVIKNAQLACRLVQNVQKKIVSDWIAWTNQVRCYNISV